MQKIIFRGSFRCELCNKEVMVPVYGDSTTILTQEEESDCIDWGRHFHWIDFHRVCAICGEIVKSGELDLAVNNRKIHINKNYTDEYKKVEHGDRFGSLLIVHDDCIKK